MSTIFDLEKAVTAEDIDVLGHVNNVVYIQWMQDVAIQHSAALGLNVEDYIRLKHAMVAVEHHVQYRKPAILGDTLILRTWLSDINALYSFRQYVFYRPRDQQIIFVANTQWACVEIDTARPKRMSPTFLNTYQVLATDQQPHDFSHCHV